MLGNIVTLFCVSTSHRKILGLLSSVGAKLSSRCVHRKYTPTHTNIHSQDSTRASTQSKYIFIATYRKDFAVVPVVHCLLSSSPSVRPSVCYSRLSKQIETRRVDVVTISRSVLVCRDPHGLASLRCRRRVKAGSGICECVCVCLCVHAERIQHMKHKNATRVAHTHKKKNVSMENGDEEEEKHTHRTNRAGGPDSTHLLSVCCGLFCVSREHY